MAETYILGPGETTALRAFNEWLAARQARKDKPPLSPEQIESAHKAWWRAAHKTTGVEEPPPTGVQQPAVKPVAPPEEVPPLLRRPDPLAPGTKADVEEAGRATLPPKPPPPPPRRGALGAMEDILAPVGKGLAYGYRTLKRPYEEIGAEVTGALQRGAITATPEPTHRIRHAVARAALAAGGPEFTKAQAKEAGRLAEKGYKEYVAPIPGGVIEYLPEMTALQELPIAETAAKVPGFRKAARYATKAAQVPYVGWVPQTAAEGAGIGAATRAAQGAIEERDPTTGQVIPPATGGDLVRAAAQGAAGFVEATAAQKALFGILGVPYRAAADWWEGAANRPRTENQATPDQPTPPVRHDADPAFVAELNKEETPATAGKKEPSAPGLSAQNERTDKPGSGAGGTDPDDDGTKPTGKGPTSPSVPPGVAPGDIREGDAVKLTPAGPGSSDQFKPRPLGPIREHFKRVEAERVEAQRQADEAARRAEQPLPLPRNIEEQRRRLRGEPEEPEAPRRSRYANLPRTLMEMLRTPRGFESPRAPAPAEPRGPRILPGAQPQVTERAAAPPGEVGPEPPVLRGVRDPQVERLIRQLRGEEPEAEPGPPVIPEERGWPTAVIDQMRREREAEDQQRQTQVEKTRQEAEQAELAQRVRNRRERETAAEGQSRLLRLLGRDREARALAALAGVERPGVEWTGPIPPPQTEFPYENEGYRWPLPEEPPPVEKPKKGKKEPPPPVEEERKPEEQEETLLRRDQERRAREAAEAEAAEAAARAAEEAKKREPPKPPDAEQLQRVVATAANKFRGARGENIGHYRGELRDAARALADIMSPEEAGKFIREEVGDGKITTALDDILGEHLKRPKPAAPAGRAGRGKPEAAKPTTTTVLPTEPPAGKAAIFAVRTKDGKVHFDPNADFHVDVMHSRNVDPDQVRDTGFIWKGKYWPGNPTWTETGEIKTIKPPGGLPDWIKPEDVRAWKDELELLRKERRGELEPDPDEEVSLRGREGTLHVEGFPNTPFRYEVVERSDLVTSHDTEGNPNPDYPANLQQRSLDRDAYRELQRKIRTEMAPERLGESPSALEGAPVVTHPLEGNVVLGGKQRTAHLQGLEEGSDADETYQNWLYQHAKDFGIDPTGLEQFARPTLIRRLTRRLTPEEAREFAPNTDVSPSMALSPSEKARMDARRLTPAMLETLDVTESGSLNTEGNLPFIRSFVAQLPATERGALVTDEGFLNTDGLRRVQNAVLTRAYNIGDELHPAIQRMFESTDEKTKTIQHALMRAAPEYAIYRGAVEDGDLDMVDVMTPLLDAASTVSALRTQRQTIQDWLNQEQLGGKDQTVEKAMKMFGENTTVPDLTDALKDMANVLHNLPQKKAGDLFERPKLPTPAQIFDMVRDPDRISEEAEDAERIQQTVRDLDREIRSARAVGDYAKVERLQKQKELLKKDEPC